MYQNYRLFLQTTQRIYSIGGAATLPDLAQLLAHWFQTSPRAAAVYDDNIVSVWVYQFDPQANAYIKRGTLPAHGRQDAINEISAFTGV